MYTNKANPAKIKMATTTMTLVRAVGKGLLLKSELFPLFVSVSLSIEEESNSEMKICVCDTGLLYVGIEA